MTRCVVYDEDEMPDDRILYSLAPSMLGRDQCYIIFKEQYRIEKEFGMSELFNRTFREEYERFNEEINRIMDKYPQNFWPNMKRRDLYRVVSSFLKLNRKRVEIFYETSSTDTTIRRVGKRQYFNAFGNYIKRIVKMQEDFEKEYAKIFSEQRFRNYSLRKKNLKDFKKDMEEFDRIIYSKFNRIYSRVIRELAELQNHLIYLSEDVTIVTKHKIFYVDDDGSVKKIYDKKDVEIVFVPDLFIREELLEGKTA